MGIMLGNAVCNKGCLWRGRGCFSFGMNYDQLIRVMGEYGYGMRGDFSLMSMIDTGNKSVRRVGTRKDPNWKSFIMLSREKGFFREELVFESNWQQELVLIQYFRTEQKDNHH